MIQYSGSFKPNSVQLYKTLTNVRSKVKKNVGCYNIYDTNMEKTVIIRLIIDMWKFVLHFFLTSFIYDM